MKNLKYQIFVGLLVTVVVYSCQKKPIEQFVPNRMFTPTAISITSGDTSVTISWPASLFSSGSGVNYTLQISVDSSFLGAPLLSLIVDSTARIITDDSLMDRTKYFARVTSCLLY